MWSAFFRGCMRKKRKLKGVAIYLYGKSYKPRWGRSNFALSYGRRGRIWRL